MQEHCVKNVNKWADVVGDHIAGERKAIVNSTCSMGKHHI